MLLKERYTLFVFLICNLFLNILLQFYDRISIIILLIDKYYIVLL